MGHVAACLGSTLVVHGGRTSPDQALDDLWAADLPSKPDTALTWRKMEATLCGPGPRYRHSAALARSETQARPCLEAP